MLRNNGYIKVGKHIIYEQQKNETVMIVGLLTNT